MGIVMAGCGVTANSLPTLAPTPTSPPLLEITSPQTGTVIYADTINISGTSPNTNQTVMVELLGPEDDQLAQASTSSDVAGTWQITLNHGYTGDPIEVLLRIVAPAAVQIQGRAQIGLVLNTTEARPIEAQISIISPIAASIVGGDVFEVTGTAISIAQGTFTVRLMSTADEIISQSAVMVPESNMENLLPWSTELTTEGYVGPAAVIVLLADTRIAEVAIEVGGAAG